MTAPFRDAEGGRRGWPANSEPPKDLAHTAVGCMLVVIGFAIATLLLAVALRVLVGAFT